MKLIFENWRKYTTSVVNEDLLVETYTSLEQAIDSENKKIAKMMKGFMFDEIKHDPKLLQAKEFLDNNPDFYINLANHITNVIDKFYVPLEAIFEGYDYYLKKERIMTFQWMVKQFKENKIEVFKIKETFSFIITILSAYLNMSKDPAELQTFFDSAPMYNLFYKQFGYIIQNYMGKDIRYIVYDYFQYLDYVPENKRNIFSVNNIEELYELSQNAANIGQEEEQRKAEEDADKGEDILLDDNQFKISIILNKAAACKLSKIKSDVGYKSRFCTGAPGLSHYEEYVKDPNDPLFYIIDKETNNHHQISFGQDEYQTSYARNPNDQEDMTEKYKKIILYVMATLDEREGGRSIPQQYAIANQTINNVVGYIKNMDKEDIAKSYLAPYYPNLRKQ